MAVACTGIGASTAAGAPMILLYGSPATNREIVRPHAPDRLPLDGRVFVQEPNVGHLFAGDADRPFRLGGVHASRLISARTAPRMAAILKAAIDAPDCHFPRWGGAGCRSHMIAVDEIDHRFAERAPNLNTAAWRGRTSRTGPRRKYPNYVPRPRAGQPGYELSRAMEALAAIPYPGGGTYAERVHFYVAPGVVSSIGVGRGPYFNLGRDRRPHFRSYEGVRSALQRAGGLWLEMYHYNRATRTRSPANTYEWQVYPWKVSLYLVGPGSTAQDPGLTAKLHFLMTRGMPKNKGGAPAECANRATPQGCQFALAGSPKNAAILANGVGQYRMEGNEAEWRAHVKARFFP